MNLVFVSNFYNHHQASLCNALWQGAEAFHFVQTAPMDPERQRLGWDMASFPPYVTADASVLDQADVVLAGSAPEALIRRAVLAGKPVLRYSERPLKNGAEPLKYLPRLVRWHHRNPTGKRVYLLCASAYAAADYAGFGLFRGRSYRWGYFPECRRYDDPDRLQAEKERRSLLWAGRFLDWKHPDDAVAVVRRLAVEGVDVRLQLTGTGPMEKALRELTQNEERITLTGPMRPEQVRRCMERSGVFLFTSDRQEGWGAVVNEAMNSGCAVVAGHAAGSVPYLLRDGENGLLYPSGDTQALYRRIRLLLDDPGLQQRLGSAAYRTVTRLWSPEEAARRLLLLAEHILAGEESPVLFEDGPCSPAPLLRDDWYRAKE